MYTYAVTVYMPNTGGCIVVNIPANDQLVAQQLACMQYGSQNIRAIGLAY